jgi:hypothetical protein
MLLLISSVASAGNRETVIEELNTSSSMDVSDDAKSWELFFDACLTITPPPTPLGDSISMNTVWPGMDGWDTVALWAAQNEHMEHIFIETTKRAIVGLPYGSENVSAEYIAKRIFAEIGVDGNLNNFDFGYIESVKLACLWATAESYVLFMEGETNRAMYLMMSELIVLRKFCDREFLEEKITFMELLSDALSNSRDMFYAYRSDIKPTQFRRLSMEWIPNIRTEPTSLLMPIGDQILSEHLLAELFNAQGIADAGRFNEVLAKMQVDGESLTGFGATRYWTKIAGGHLGYGDSKKRLQMMYDDWWRRWKLRFFHPMLATPTHFENANAVNYAAVKMIVQNTEELFEERKTLLTQLNGTIVSAALCGYYNQFGLFPSSIKKMYAQFLHRGNNLDPMRKNEMRNDEDWELYTGPAGQFHYRVLITDTKISTLRGSIPIEHGECLLYGLSFNEENDGGLDADLDSIIWPPMKSLERNAGLLN